LVNWIGVRHESRNHRRGCARRSDRMAITLRARAQHLILISRARRRADAVAIDVIISRKERNQFLDRFDRMNKSTRQVGSTSCASRLLYPATSMRSLQRSALPPRILESFGQGRLSARSDLLRMADGQQRLQRRLRGHRGAVRAQLFRLRLHRRPSGSCVHHCATISLPSTRSKRSVKSARAPTSSSSSCMMCRKPRHFRGRAFHTASGCTAAPVRCARQACQNVRAQRAVLLEADRPPLEASDANGTRQKNYGWLHWVGTFTPVCTFNFALAEKQRPLD
jgi:hypothetical protein